jgi:hypothetical protein
LNSKQDLAVEMDKSLMEKQRLENIEKQKHFALQDTLKECLATCTIAGADPVTCTCPAGASLSPDGLSCVPDTCTNGEINPPICNICPEGKHFEYKTNDIGETKQMCVDDYDFCGNGIEESTEQCDGGPNCN